MMTLFEKNAGFYYPHHHVMVCLNYPVDYLNVHSISSSNAVYLIGTGAVAGRAVAADVALQSTAMVAFYCCFHFDNHIHGCRSIRLRQISNWPFSNADQPISDCLHTISVAIVCIVVV